MTQSNGILMQLKSRFDRNRLGDLLVARGRISEDELMNALKSQKETGHQLGHVLCESGIISKSALRTTLMEQFGYRAMAACFTMVFSFSAFVGGSKTARAEGAQSVTQKQELNLSKSSTSYIKMASIQSAPRVQKNTVVKEAKLFGTSEVRSTNLKAFKKWTDVVSRIDEISMNAGMNKWQKDIQSYKNLPLAAKAKAINEYVNKVRYVEDSRNFGSSDYWATPTEFFARGGDCEDFAIAKYVALKSLGVAESQMRLAIVQDKVKKIPHAILIVYTDEGALMLDNQIKQTANVSDVSRYQPIYSINRDAWWRHLS